MYRITVRRSAGLVLCAIAGLVANAGSAAEPKPDGTATTSEISKPLANSGAPSTATWARVERSLLGPGFSPGVVWSPELKRFVFFCGSVSHQFTGERPYDVMSLDPADLKWRNDLPKGAEGRGGETGNVRDVDFKTPYFEMADKDGLVRPNRRFMCMGYQYTLTPWDGQVYAAICGRTLTYAPAERVWRNLKPATAPMPEVDGQGGLSWSALCADPVNQEIVLFGGCGLLTSNASPGTWVYSRSSNEWRKLELAVEPPPRALSPMVFDPASGKIVLFGGDRLDQLYADTWLYDTKSRTWTEAKPARSPSPRFGHALLYLPKSRKIALIGGKQYSSSTGYVEALYKPLPFDVWLYDVCRNEWNLSQRIEQGAPPQPPTEAACAAASDDDTVLFISAGTNKASSHSAWIARLDGAAIDAEGTAKYGVKTGAIAFRTGSFDPDWYTNNVPPPDPAAAAGVLKNLIPNQWLALQCPKWPDNRQVGGWSTVTIDTDRDQILHMGGGHSSYFGNDMAHYDILTGRWSIACRPQFALEYNFGLNGPGLWAFNGAPWGNHNYHAYAYDPTLQRVVYIKGAMTLLYDPATRVWPFTEKSGKLPFLASKYVNYLCTTPKGAVCWTPYASGSSKTGLWQLEGGKAWKEFKTTGEPLPSTVCDGSTITYDSKRDRLLFTTSVGTNGPHGQVWACGMKSGVVTKLNPEGMDRIKGSRFARESVYLPGSDLLMVGCLLPGGKPSVPFYDGDANRWLVAEMTGAEFMNGGKPGSSVDLGLVYDAKRDVVWGVLCSLRGTGALNAVRVDKATLHARPLSPVEPPTAAEVKP